MQPEPTTTQLLASARECKRGAVDALLPRLYDELRVLARARLRKHRSGETLNTTALVHEAYLKLTSGETPSFEDKTHFFALAARAMRFVLIGYAREQTAQKRGGAQADLSLDEALLVESANAEATDLISLDSALEQLAEVSPRLAEVVELRFFGGMTHEEIAEVTGRSERTIKRDWRRARSWLFQAMKEGDGPLPDDSAKEE